MKVNLENYEMRWAAEAGMIRRIENIIKGTKPGHNLSREDQNFEIDIQGALAECAVAKALGVYWGGKGKVRDPDVGDIEVRQTEYSTGKLIVHKKDHDDRRFYLVTGKDGSYVVRGWMLGKDAKKEKWWGELRPGRPSFNVPQEYLNPPNGE